LKSEGNRGEGGRYPTHTLNPPHIYISDSIAYSREPPTRANQLEKKKLVILMIVGRGEVKSFLFDKNEYTIETSKKILKEIKCNYEPTVIQFYTEKYDNRYKKRLKTVRRYFKSPDEIDDLKISFDDKYIIFEFDSTVGDDNLEIYTNFCGNGIQYDMLVNLIDIIN
jgi:hypothetical protein